MDVSSPNVADVERTKSLTVSQDIPRTLRKRIPQESISSFDKQNNPKASLSDISFKQVSRDNLKKDTDGQSNDNPCDFKYSSETNVYTAESLVADRIELPTVSDAANRFYWGW